MSLQPAYHEHFDRIIMPVAIRDIDEDKADALAALMHDHNLSHIVDQAEDMNDPVVLLWVYRNPQGIFSASMTERENVPSVMETLEKDLGLTQAFGADLAQRKAEMLDNFKEFLSQTDEYYYMWEAMFVGGKDTYTEEEAIEIVEMLAEERGLEKPIIRFSVDPDLKAHTGEQAGGSYDRSENSLNLGEMIKTSVLHEIAHWLTEHDDVANGVTMAAPHNAPFSRNAIDLYERFAGKDKGVMLIAAQSLNVIPTGASRQTYYEAASLDALIANAESADVPEEQPEAIHVPD